ncbi:molecular chaperone TorD [Parasalinivibrio latis]|uniref:molecular chaperone TorD n=1 Tax=Parasalinivibrio latis TaxID=2952610 RepID=UPI0030E21259
MQEFIAINEQRAEFYWWMSSLLARELTAKDLENYLGGEMVSYYSALAMTPELKAPVNAFRDALDKLEKREDNQLELAADFCGLFLSTPKTGALPYASIYVGESGLLNDKPAQEMGDWMQRFGIAQRKDFNEPFDHAAVMLDFLGNLIVMSNQKETEEEREALMQEQLQFIDSMLMNWLPTFSTAVASRDPFGFYAAAMSLLVAFVNVDRAFLIGE